MIPTVAAFGVWWALVVLAMVAAYTLAFPEDDEDKRMADNDEKTTGGREDLIWNGQLGGLRLRVVRRDAKIGEVVLWDVWNGDDCLACGAAPFQRDEGGVLQVDAMKVHAARIAKATARAIVLGEAS